MACLIPSKARSFGVSAAVNDPVSASIALVAGSTTVDCLRIPSGLASLARSAGLFGCLVAATKVAAAH